MLPNQTHEKTALQAVTAAKTFQICWKH